MQDEDSPQKVALILDTVLLTWPAGDDVLDLDALLVRHEADDAENDESGKYGRTAVGEGDEDCVTVTVVVELVVAGQRDEASEGRAERVKDLRRRIRPHLRERRQ